MDALTAGPRHLDHRTGVQPAGRRPARRVRPAAVLLLILALVGFSCGRKQDADPNGDGDPAPAPKAPAEDFFKRYVDREYSGLKDFDGPALVAGLRRYVNSDGNIYPPEGKRNRSLHNYLYFAFPDPALLKPLLGPRKQAEEIEGWVLRRDTIGLAVVTSFYRRLARNPDDLYTKELWDVLTYASIHFSFDALYGESHTRTGAEIADLFMDPRLTACAASKKALETHLDALLASWRTRVTEKATTTMMAIIIRHVGGAGLDRLFFEWKVMSSSERYNLLALARGIEGPSAASRKIMVEALAGDTMDLREAALETLEELGAPVDNVEIVAPDAELQKALAALRRWAAKTDS